MSKITSKLQVTIPKAIADQYSLHPGDEIEWQAAGDAIRLVPAVPAGGKKPLSIEERIKWFRETETWIKKRRVKPLPEGADRGWKREDLYTRGRTR
jgi:AbrB family looped-hinge helix DNA binding protein